MSYYDTKLQIPNWSDWDNGDIYVVSPDNQARYMITGNGEPLNTYSGTVVIRSTNGGVLATVQKTGTDSRYIPNRMKITLRARGGQSFDVSVKGRIQPHQPPSGFFSRENTKAWVYCSSGHKWHSGRRSEKTPTKGALNSVSVYTRDDCDFFNQGGDAVAHVNDSSMPKREIRHMELEFKAAETIPELLLAFMVCKQMQYAGMNPNTVRGKMIVAGAGSEVWSGGLIQLKHKGPSSRRSCGFGAVQTKLLDVPQAIGVENLGTNSAPGALMNPDSSVRSNISVQSHASVQSQVSNISAYNGASAPIYPQAQSVYRG